MMMSSKPPSFLKYKQILATVIFDNVNLLLMSYKLQYKI